MPVPDNDEDYVVEDVDDEDFAPLVTGDGDDIKNGRNNGSKKNGIRNPSSILRQFAICSSLLVALVLCLYMFRHDGKDESNKMGTIPHAEDGGVISIRTNKTIGSSNEENAPYVSEIVRPPSVPKPHFDEPPPTPPLSENSTQTATQTDDDKTFTNVAIKVMKQSLNKSVQDLVDKLKIDYGDETFTKMFMSDDGRFRRVFESPSSPNNGKSWARAKRKMMLKLLEIQTKQQRVPFVWATGGHSAAAGHGNFYDESYTSYLNKAATPIFKSVGIDLITRSYAMGGSSSAPEIALCAEEIFGQDLDVIVWDFGMTDGRNSEKLFLYLYRTVGYNRNHPIGIAYHANGRWEKERRRIVGVFENDYGLPVLISSEDVLTQVLDYVPDSLGLSRAEIDNMPKFVRSFRCGNNELEKGEPYCDASKFNHTLCPTRKFQTSWHPGWYVKIFYSKDSYYC